MVRIPPTNKIPSTASSSDPNAQILPSILNDLAILQSISCTNPPGDPYSSSAMTDLISKIQKLKSYTGQESPYVSQMMSILQQIDVPQPQPSVEDLLPLFAKMEGTGGVLSQVANGQTPIGSAPVQKLVLQFIGRDFQVLIDTGSKLPMQPLIDLALEQVSEIGNASKDLLQSLYSLEINFNSTNVDNFVDQVNKIQ